MTKPALCNPVIQLVMKRPAAGKYPQRVHNLRSAQFNKAPLKPGACKQLLIYILPTPTKATWRKKNTGEGSRQYGENLQDCVLFHGAFLTTGSGNLPAKENAPAIHSDHRGV